MKLPWHVASAPTCLTKQCLAVWLFQQNVPWRFSDMNETHYLPETQKNSAEWFSVTWLKATERKIHLCNCRCRLPPSWAPTKGRHPGSLRLSRKATFPFLLVLFEFLWRAERPPVQCSHPQKTSKLKTKSGRLKYLWVFWKVEKKKIRINSDLPFGSPFS